MPETTPPRELGAEQAAEACPNCGGQQVVTTSVYGSYTVTCPACREKASDAPREQAAASLPREVGTPEAPTATPPTAQTGESA